MIKKHKSILLPLIYSAKKTPQLKEGKYAIHSYSDQILREEEVIEKACEQRGIKASEMTAALDDFFNTLISIMSKGRGFNTSWVNGRIATRGILNGEDDDFDPGKKQGHQFSFHITLSKRILDVLHYCKIPFKRKAKARQKPLISKVYDFFTKRKDVLLAGQCAVLQGSNFPDDALGKVSITLTNDDQTFELHNFRIESTRQILLQVPDDLPAGEYRIAVIGDYEEKYLRDTYSNTVSLLG